MTVAVVFALGVISCESSSSGDYPPKKVLYGNIVDVKARKVFPGELTIYGGKVLSVKESAGVYDTYILPGFVDSHIHIESTLMVPENYARMAVANGVVAAVCDPHEIANVLGVDGIDFMIDNGKQARFYFNFMAPSCVPSTTFETSGATIDAEQVAQLMQRDEIMGLAEMMNAAGIPFLWLNFSDGELPDAPPNFYNVGIRKNIQDYIQKADYLVQLSDQEAFGNSVLEALTLKTAVICTPIPAFKDFGLEDGVNAHVVPFSMEFDVRKLLQIPQFDFFYDNEKRIRQWEEIL